ncbi:hypothetical protein [Paraburkholderia phenazinium]|jgi:hypothetical protein|uniref:Uncharacterized protein n=1 Tax=Paraburkholderia phenazinium TaxID=60549 RepID=A0A1G8EMM2_9BURK|nr:hypothetical protein [Paraburkholderia phenazinium]SDH71126.1 hypothetical protein SAMN05216466_112149 [Paraburkholderia phenazinium]
MDRRSFVMTGAWLSAAGGGAWPWLARAASTSNTLAVVDASLGEGRVLSGWATRRAIPVFETGDDIGALWYAALAPRLAATPGLVIGVTRASDYFVLGELALRSARMVEHERAWHTGPRTPVAFLIGPAAQVGAPGPVRHIG